MASSDFAERVHEAVSSLVPGDLVTYGEIALQVGRPGAARAVGRILARSGGGLPWWRVVTTTGRLVPGHETQHAKRLRAEGFIVKGNRVRI